MRPSVLFSLAALFFSATMAMPVENEDLDDCAPARSVEARAFIYHRASSKGVRLKPHQPPVFWTGKINRKGAKAVADLLKKDKSIVGSHGGFTVFDALDDAKVPRSETANWTPDPDWRAVCGAFAEYAKPADKKAHLVYGPEYDKVHNVWSDDEWPALEKNTAVAQVHAYEMNEDGRTWTDKGEIKASRKGSPVHSANASPHNSDVE